MIYILAVIYAIFKDIDSNNVIKDKDAYFDR